MSSKNKRQSLAQFHKQRIELTGYVNKIRPLKTGPTGTAGRTGLISYCIKCDELVNHIWVDLPETLALNERVTVSGIVTKYTAQRTGVTSYCIDKDIKLEKRHDNAG